MNPSTIKGPSSVTKKRVAHLSLVAENDVEPNTSEQPKLKVKKNGKVHLDLPPIYQDYLEKIAEWTGAKTFSEVIRTALKLYFVILRETGGRGEIFVRTEDGETKLIV